MEITLIVLYSIPFSLGATVYSSKYPKRRFLNDSFNNSNISNYTNTSHTILQDDGHSFFNIIISIFLACVLVYIIIYLYKKYLVANTRLDYEVNFIKDKYVHPSQELADFR